jgi:uncharacterized protein involved in exopolysaccharide biosynthesis
MGQSTPPRPDSAGPPDFETFPADSRIGTPAPAEGKHALEYVKVLTKRRWTAISAFAVVLLATLAYGLTTTPLYEARVQLLIESDSPKIILFKDAIERDTDADEYYQTQNRVLQSRTIARKTIERLDLWAHPEFGGGEQSDRKDERSIFRRGLDAAVTGAGRLIARFSNSADAGEQKSAEPRGADESTVQAARIDAFLERLTVAPVRSSRLVDVKFGSR